MKGYLHGIALAVALTLPWASASAQIFSEDFTSDPGLIQTDIAPNDVGDGDGNGSETGPLYNGQWNPAGYVDVHWDRGSNTGGRTDSESSLLGIGQTLTESDSFGFSIDVNLYFPTHHHIGYLGLVDSSVGNNQSAGHAFYYLRNDALRFGLAQYHWEIASGLPLTEGVNYRLSAEYDPGSAEWNLLVTNLDTNSMHWSDTLASAVGAFSLDHIGVAGWSDGSGEGNLSEEIYGTSDNWVVTPEPASAALLGLLALLRRRG